MGRRIVVMKLIGSLGNFECEAHKVHKLSQRRLTADCLAPRESDCSRMQSNVSSDWLPSYIMATRPVLEIFKIDGYFPDSLSTFSGLGQYVRGKSVPLQDVNTYDGLKVQLPPFLNSALDCELSASRLGYFVPQESTLVNIEHQAERTPQPVRTL